jgi:Uma2 family endonuclease
MALKEVCGETRFADNHKDVILNPGFIAEVLSESTAGFDRGKKFLSYQQIGSLKEFLFVAQDEILVEKYTRQSDDSWVYTKVSDLEGILSLQSIECNVALRDIYDKAT